VTNGTDVVETRSASGTLVFNGAGSFSFTGQQLVNLTPAAALSGAGTYTVKSTGVVTLTNPLLTSANVNGRLGVGALVGSSTEAGPTTFDLFIAIPAASAPLTSGALSGAYQISSLEFPSGGVTNIRNTNSKLTANGAGAFAETVVVGHARNLGNQLRTQDLGLITYSVSPDATGLLNFPAGNPTQQLIEGAKSIYVSSDGNYFIGGSLATGEHGIVVGVKSFPGGATNNSWTGFFHAAGLSFDADQSRLAGAAGSLNVMTQGAVWSRRIRQSDGVLNTSVLAKYSLGADGSGPFLSAPEQVNVALDNQTFSSTGVANNSSTYELAFGTGMPPTSGAGVFIDPQRVVNAANYGLGYPLSPGGFFSIFGTSLATQTGAALGYPFPKNLLGVTVTVNGIAAPLYYVSSGLISGVVPFTAAGRTATLVVTSNGVKSNSVEVALSPTAAGVFTLPQNGLGDGATLHANNSIVNAANPARTGEVVEVFLAGLGAVSPGVQDGTAASAVEPLSRVLSQVVVTVDGSPCIVSYQGLAPMYAGLYQVNFQIPAGLAVGTHRLAIQTPESFTSMANIEIGP